jgi:hypothetical protein
MASHVRSLAPATQELRRLSPVPAVHARAVFFQDSPAPITVGDPRLGQSQWENLLLHRVARNPPWDPVIHCDVCLRHLSATELVQCHAHMGLHFHHSLSHAALRDVGATLPGGWQREPSLSCGGQLRWALTVFLPFSYRLLQAA